MNYRQEFRNFDFDIPHLEGFIDNSWHNDVCPSFVRKLNDSKEVVVWVNYADESRRECGGKQFAIVIRDADFEDKFCGDVDLEIETNSWDELTAKINQIFGK